MAEKGAKLVVIMFLIVSCMAAYVPTGLSLRPIEHHQMFNLPAGCWKVITGLGDCGTQFYGAIASWGFQEIRPSCCQLISSAVETCWNQFFPYGPAVPPSLRIYCLHQQQPDKTTMAKPLSRGEFN